MRDFKNDMPLLKQPLATSYVTPECRMAMLAYDILCRMLQAMVMDPMTSPKEASCLESDIDVNFITLGQYIEKHNPDAFDDLSSDLNWAPEGWTPEDVKIGFKRLSKPE